MLNDTGRKSLGFRLTLALCFILIGFASCEASDRLKKEQTDLASLLDELESTKLQLEYIDIKVRDSRVHVKKLEDKIGSQRSKVMALQERLSGVEGDSASTSIAIGQFKDEMEKSQTRYEKVLERFRQRLVQLHKIKQGTLINSILSANDLNTFLNRYQMVKYLLHHDRSLLAEFQQARTDLAASSEALKEKQTRLVELAETTRKSKEDLLSETSSLSAMLKSLLLERKIFLDRQERMKKNFADLESEIGKIEGIRKKDPEKFEQGLNSASKEPRPGTQKLPAVGQPTEKYPQPYSTQVPQNKPPDQPVSNTQEKNNGFIWPLKKFKDLGLKPGDTAPVMLDIRFGDDTDVYAVDSGKVMFKGPMGSFGNMVIISHKGGYTSVYGRLNDLWVGLGQAVESGEVIGKMSAGADSALHFELRLGGKNLNPLELLPKLQ